MEDLIDRKAMMNYVRSNKINIGKVAHIVIMKQEPVAAVPLSMVEDIKTILIKDANSAVNDNLREILVAFANHVIDNIDRKMEVDK